MSHIPPELRYTQTHEWMRALPDGSVEIGITDYAQKTLGDLVFVEVPEPGRVLKVGDSCAVVESVKAASDVYAPVAGTVLRGNPNLANAPEAVNIDPYGAGWLMRVQPVDPAALAQQWSATEYQSFLDGENP